MSLLIFQSDGKTFLIKFNTQRRPTLAIDCSAEFCSIAVFIQSCNVNLGGCDSVKRDGDFKTFNTNWRRTQINNFSIVDVEAQWLFFRHVWTRIRLDV